MTTSLVNSIPLANLRMSYVENTVDTKSLPKTFICKYNGTVGAVSAVYAGSAVSTDVNFEKIFSGDDSSDLRMLNVTNLDGPTLSPGLWNVEFEGKVTLGASDAGTVNIRRGASTLIATSGSLSATTDRVVVGKNFHIDTDESPADRTIVVYITITSTTTGDTISIASGDTPNITLRLTKLY